MKQTTMMVVMTEQTTMLNGDADGLTEADLEADVDALSE